MVEFNKETNRFILTREELSMLDDVRTSFKVISANNPELQGELKQEIINADSVMSTLECDWWLKSHIIEEEQNDTRRR